MALSQVHHVYEPPVHTTHDNETVRQPMALRQIHHVYELPVNTTHDAETKTYGSKSD